MGCKGVNSWTLAGLVGAFLDLAIAYFMLGISAFVFFPSKILSLCELFMPCPCSGFLGYQNSTLCLQKLLFHWPVRKIHSVMELVKNRFPFDEILFEDQSCGSVVEGLRDRNRENGEVELDGEGCSSAFSSPRLRISVDREGGLDSKGKKIVSRKQKSATRRPKRASLVYGKAAPFLPSDVTGSVEIGAPQPSNNDSEMRSEVRVRLDAVNGIEADLQDWRRKEIVDDASSDRFTCDAGNRTDNVANDSITIRMLERLLEEEKSARAALYQELEEERAAAATAADETLAMILRLQEDKGTVEMEAKQYQRMIDEKFAYDEEEMSILKEILVRRETEIHFLEKEVEAYQAMNFSDNDLLVDDLGCEVKINEQRRSFSFCSDEKAVTMTRHSVNNETIFEMEAPRAENYSSDYADGCSPVSEIEMAGKHSGVVSDLSTSRKSINLAEKEKEPKDIGMMFQGGEMEQNFVEELEKDEERLNEADNKRHSSVPDQESTVYDVHVIDDKTIIWKEKDAQTSVLASTATSGSDSPSTSTEEIQGNVQRKASKIELPSNSSSVEYERMKIDSEIELLREKLRIVQEEKEKFSLTGDRRERENIRLQLVEEIVKQLKEIQQLREPARHASLPPLSSKGSLKKRRSRSLSLEASDST